MAMAANGNRILGWRRLRCIVANGVAGRRLANGEKAAYRGGWRQLASAASMVSYGGTWLSSYWLALRGYVSAAWRKRGSIYLVA